MTRSAEIAILGGGCAGLSLATSLAATARPRSIVVVEKRNGYCEDRTWCGWATEPHQFDDCVRRNWSQWRVSTTDETHDVSAGDLRYESISSAAFYAKARASIEASPGIELITGAGVASVTQDDERAVVTLEDGRRIAARYVVDTIPRPRELAYPWMWQSFVGIELEAPDAGASDVPELMDFRVPQLGGVTFLYTIPFGRDRALFEMTTFSSQRASEADLSRALVGTLARRFPNGYRALRREHADLPMSPADREPDRRVVPAGTAGGSMRPATGFAFHAIQRWARACALEIDAGRPPISARLHPALLWMDRVFMSVIADRPSDAPELYARLFAHTESDVLVRFLAGIPRVADLANVARALPLGRFTKAAAQTLVA